MPIPRRWLADHQCTRPCALPVQPTDSLNDERPSPPGGQIDAEEVQQCAGCGLRPRYDEGFKPACLDLTQSLLEWIAQFERGSKVGDVAGEDGCDVCEVLTQCGGPARQLRRKRSRRSRRSRRHTGEVIEARGYTRQGG